ncbi:MAG: hypothetical protein FJ125_00330 [Deltaproteobacteria bacterium]|nr:hypothetical protein [Deltaproteobacteria bacterium]
MLPVARISMMVLLLPCFAVLSGCADAGGGLDGTAVGEDGQEEESGKLDDPNGNVRSCAEGCLDGERCFDARCVVELCDEVQRCSPGGLCLDGSCCYDEQECGFCAGEDCAGEPASCAVDGDCGAGRRCRGGQCVAALCDDDHPCTGDGFCFDGVCCYGEEECGSSCTGEDCDPQPEPPAFCRNDDDCGRLDRCREGACVRDLCDEDAHCSAGGICRSGNCCYSIQECRLLPTQCTSGNQCAGDELCYGGSCVPARCDDSHPCAEGGFCIDGGCCYGEKCWG